MIRALTHPQQLGGIVVFTLLALLPSLIHLSWLTVPVTNPLLAIGPLAAGCGLAVRFRFVFINPTLIGTVAAALIWTTNWIMSAGDYACCATLPVRH